MNERENNFFSVFKNFSLNKNLISKRNFILGAKPESLVKNNIFLSLIISNKELSKPQKS
jgi:hypothetical protein